MHRSSARPFPRLKTTLTAALAGLVAANPTSGHEESTPPEPIIADGECDCFLTNGSSSSNSYFSHHMFFDFRSLPQYASGSPPPFVMNDSLAAIAPVTSEYFARDEWNGTWQIQGWSNKDSNVAAEDQQPPLSGNATVLMVNSQSNVFIQQNEDKSNASQTHLSLRTKRLPSFQTTASFQSRSRDFRFVSVRILARTTGSPGAVTAMFTYDGSAALQEADLEVLTRDPRETVQYTNQPGFNPDGSRNTQASHNATLPGSLLWSDWAVHRLDWLPDRSVWYVNGVETATIETQVPRDASSLNFNSWSDGGTWSGNMSLYDEATFEIQWIQVVYNSTSNDQTKQKHASGNLHHQDRGLGPQGQLVRRKGSTKNAKCKVVCSIDESPELGKATLLWNSTATSVLSAHRRGRIVWPWSLMVGSLLWYGLI